MQMTIKQNKTKKKGLYKKIIPNDKFTKLREEPREEKR